MRIRALAAGACAVLVFQAAYVVPGARAAGATVAQQPAHNSTLDDKDGVDPETGLQNGATEIVAARTEYSQTFANPDGSTTTQFYAEPVFYRADGTDTLEPIMLGFEPAGSAFVSDRAPVSVKVAASGPTGNFMSTSYQDLTIGIRLPEELAKAASTVAPTIDGPVADYPDLMPGVGLRVIAGAHGAKSFFVWREPSANPTISYVVDAPELTLAPQEDGSIALVDAKGATVASIPVPYAVDSAADGAFGSGHYTNAVALSVDPDGQTVTVSVDPEWLKAAVYPVYVDPSTDWLWNAGSSSYGDAFIDSIAPTTNFGNYVRPDSPYYHELWNGVSPADGGNVYDFLRWDLSSYAGVTVDSASLRLRPYHQYYNAPTAETTYVRRVTSSWTEGGVTWNTKPSYTSTGTVTVGCVEGSYCTFNVTAIAQLWLQGIGPQSNYGFQVDTIGKNDTYWKRFVAAEESGSQYRPAFSMTYHTPTATALYPTGGGPTPATTLSWSYSDASALPQTQYHVDLATDAAFTQNFVTSGDIASAATSWAVPSALTAGTTYYWRVKSYNGTSWSPWSATASFVNSLTNLGLQSQFRTEDFDLGGGDTASVNVSTGNLVLSHPVVSLPILGGALDLSATYNSLDAGSVGLGAGWRLDVQRRLAVNADSTVTFTDADGSRHTFTSPTGSPTVTYTRPVTLYATLVRDTAATPDRFTLTYRDQSKDVFDEDISGTGLLKQIQDRHGNTVTLAYTGGSSRISTITDPAGRSVGFSWSTSPDRLTSIVDWANVSGGIVQTWGSGNRTHRFFYDASNRLIGWADPLNTSGSCPTGGSHLTCLTYGSTLAITKTQTVEAITGGAITTSTRVITTQFGLVGGEVVSVKDAEQVSLGGPATTFSRAAGQMVVVRPGTPASTTTYGYLATTDAQARVQSIWRLMSAATIEQRTTYNATYPIEPASVTDDYGGSLARTVNYTYVASSLGLLSRIDEPLDGTNRRYTDYTFNANNDLTRTLVYQASAPSTDSETRYCYTTSGCSTSATDLVLRSTVENYVDGSAGGHAGESEDVTTSYEYDAAGQRSRSTRANYSSSDLIDAAVTAWTYDSYGNVTAEIRNYVDGAVSLGGDDVTPNATTNARTDLTSVYDYDTAGNRVAAADPRWTIESLTEELEVDDYTSRTVYDARNQAIIAQLPTTPGGGECTPAGPSCRQSPTTYDELSLVRQTTDFGGLVTATKYDRASRSIETYEDTDGAGGTAAAITSKAGYDTQGRTTWTEDRIQANDPGGGTDPGRTEQTYDELGRVTKTTEAAGSSPDIRSETTFAYDNLDRTTSETVGANTAAGQTTTSTYDIGGRVTDLNDEFTCTTTTYDYRDLAIAVVEGKTPGNPCTGSGTRTITNSYDGLGRLWYATVGGSGDILTNDGFDSAGRSVYRSQYIGGIEWTSWFTFNPLDEQIVVYRYKWVDPSVSEETWLQSNYDAAGNNTDRCSWLVEPTIACLPADQAMSPEPTKRTTTGYDARNMRTSYLDPAVGETTYDPTANYQVKGVFTKTAAGKEHQAIHEWDARNRLDTITHYLCATAQRPVCTGGNILSQSVIDDYAYDDNDNRTQVAENNGASSATSYYCYDGLNRLTGTYGATNCAGPVETYAYDAAGNRTGAAGRTFIYDAEGQLATCTSPACTASHDPEGRLTGLVDAGVTWTYQYDAEGRLTAACKAAACTGSIDRLDFAWGDAGQRVQVKETSSGGTVTTTDLRYEGTGVVQEVTGTGITRTFTLDEAGSIVKVTITGDAGANNGTYLVTWNGHGDALALWQIDLSTGGLTLANSFTYTSWGTPTTATHNGIGDLRFRYLYVGRYGVAWDDFAGAGLLHMGARHYRPALGRFLQPDPSAEDPNLYRYAANSPTVRVDPNGTCPAAVAWVIPSPPTWLAAAIGTLACAAVAAIGAVAISTTIAGDTPQAKTKTTAKPDVVPRDRLTKRAVVIGESMTRVIPFAIAIGADWFSSPRRELGLRRDNLAWLARRVREGRVIIDIGLDRTRPASMRSTYYTMEYRFLRGIQYPLHVRLPLFSYPRL
jgi:RHS repeat-associated protein